MSFLTRFNAAVGKWSPLVILGIGGAHPAYGRDLWTGKDRLTLRTANARDRWTKELSEDACVRTCAEASLGGSRKGCDHGHVGTF